MGRDIRQVVNRYREYISIHSPRMGRDRGKARQKENAMISIHSPRMGRDHIGVFRFQQREDFNPLSPHGERLVVMEAHKTLHPISIHSPRMGRDEHPAALPVFLPLISIHSPRMGRDGAPACTNTGITGFQSTLPAWGETKLYIRIDYLSKFQSTLPAWGETSMASTNFFDSSISIHSPRMGRDY